MTLVGGAVLTGAALPREASGTGTVGSERTDLSCCCWTPAVVVIGVAPL